MKIFAQIISISLLLLLISSCATTLPPLPEKYALDGQLEEVKDIYRYRLMNWYTVDRQSLILQTGPSDYYLLVLKTTPPDLMFNTTIGVSHTGSFVRSGIDSVTLYQGLGRMPYTIDRIYRINGNEQMHAIRAQLAPE